MSNNYFDYSFMETNQTDFQQSDDILQMLESIPGIDDNKSERDSANEQWEREHRVGLASLRSAMTLTQVEVATRMGVTQASISRTEARDDVLLSTLSNYLHAIGANAILTIKVGNSTVETNLDNLLAATF